MAKDSGAARPRPLAARLLEGIAAEALAACDPAAAVARCAPGAGGRLTVAGRIIPLAARGRLIVLAYGKAAPSMLEGLLRRVREAQGRRIVRALQIAPRPAPGQARPIGPGAPAEKARGGFRPALAHGDHPLPLAASFRAGRAALRLAAGARPGDDVIHLVSGGGSALMAAPLAPFMSPAGKTLLHRLLLVSGAPIGTINAVRRHFSAVKGGRLAAAARRARTQTSLILCDVDPERYEEVASGPSTPDPTTLGEVVMAIDRYGIAPALPARVLEGLRKGRIPETPKPRDPIFRRHKSLMILSNRDLRNAALRAGLSRGLSAESMPSDLTGPVEEAVERVARAVESAPPGTRLLVLGGEVTTAPEGHGKGGRAQEFALRLALRMEGLGSRPWAFLACGSDGVDGSSPAAGAFVDQTTLARARAARLEAGKLLRDSDSHRFFSRLGDAFVTGPTGTNVRDLYLLLTGEAREIRSIRGGGAGALAASI
jgi:glycerate 2-kinase